MLPGPVEIVPAVAGQAVYVVGIIVSTITAPTAPSVAGQYPTYNPYTYEFTDDDNIYNVWLSDVFGNTQKAFSTHDVPFLIQSQIGTGVSVQDNAATPVANSVTVYYYQF